MKKEAKTQCNTYHPRYKDEKGREETSGSYLTFLHHFIDIQPRPTINQVSKSSGYKFKTVELWFNQNKYIKRYEQWNNQKKNEQNKSIIEEIKILNESLIQLDKENINTSNAFKRKHNKSMKEYSSDKENPSLDKIDITSEEYRILKECNIEDQRGAIRIKDSLLKALDIDERINNESDNREALTEALERNNLPRHKSNLESVSEKYKEYEDDDF